MISYVRVCYLGWGTASLKLRQFNSAVCEALVGVPVHVLHLWYARCYTDLFYGVGVGLVSLLPRDRVCRISGVWAFIYRVVLVTVMTSAWPGACVFLNLFFFFFLPKCRFCGLFIYGYANYLC